MLVSQSATLALADTVPLSRCIFFDSHIQIRNICENDLLDQKKLMCILGSMANCSQKRAKLFFAPAGGRHTSILDSLRTTPYNMKRCRTSA